MASDPFVGEIMLFAGNFAPAGWATCDGQLIAIADNNTLFNLIGTTYGGDGQNTFALPNLGARTPIHMGSNGTSTYNLADSGGATTVTLTANQMPMHSHGIIADGNAATSGDPTNAYYASSAPNKLYSSSAAPALRSMNPAMLPAQGGSQPHENMQPFLAITFCISLYGIYPSPT
jgi:microcystin-dependent protein